MAIHLLAVDLQNEFASNGGAHYQPRPCVPFLRTTLFPWVQARGSTIAEIISDYRTTPPAVGAQVCVPGTWGYQSIIPADLRHPSVWVKAEPSPAWIRAGGGNAAHQPGVPYPDPAAFSAWLRATIGPPTPDTTIVLLGLVLEICVLSTLQEVHHRGYQTAILVEGVDTYSSDATQKHAFLDTLLPFWGGRITWTALQQTCHAQ